MDNVDQNQITELLVSVAGGDSDAFDQLMPLVYQDLRRIARQQLRGRRRETLNTTALVNEAYLKLVDQKRASWKDRAHFFGVAAFAMRQIIVDYAREQLALKRGGGRRRVELDETKMAIAQDAETLVEVHEALIELKRHDERMVRVVECRFFVGMTEQETADALDVSTRTVERDWTRARAWLSRAMVHKPPRDVDKPR